MVGYLFSGYQGKDISKAPVLRHRPMKYDIHSAKTDEISFTCAALAGGGGGCGHTKREKTWSPHCGTLVE